MASRSSSWTPMAELSRLPPVQRRFRRSRTPSNRYPRSQPATRSGQAPCLCRESVVHFSHASRAERSSGKEVCGLHRGSPTKAHTHRVLVTAVLDHLRGVECYPKHLLALADRKKWASRPYSSSFSERCDPVLALAARRILAGTREGSEAPGAVSEGPVGRDKGPKAAAQVLVHVGPDFFVRPFGLVVAGHFVPEVSGRRTLDAMADLHDGPGQEENYDGQNTNHPRPKLGPGP